MTVGELLTYLNEGNFDNDMPVVIWSEYDGEYVKVVPQKAHIATDNSWARYEAEVIIMGTS